jgi:hypothetical protein
MAPVSLMPVGMPSTGKTSFLAALAEFLFHHKSSFQLTGPAESTEYLNSIHSEWLKGEDPQRTIDTEGGIVELSIRHIESNRQLQLLIPDGPGEDYRDSILLLRRCRDELAKSLQSADGYLLFYHPRKIKFGVSISDVNAAIGPDEKEEDEKSGKEMPSKAELLLSHLTAANYVDLLQCLSTFGTNRKNLAVITSAWDLLPEAQQSDGPRAAVRSLLPLLDQYINNNSALWQPNYFGLSATGGDLANADEKQRLLQIDPPVERIRVAGPNGPVDMGAILTSFIE